MEGIVALLQKGSVVEKWSIFVVFLKKSSDEALNGSSSLNGSPSKGSEGKILEHIIMHYSGATKKGKEYPIADAMSMHPKA